MFKLEHVRTPSAGDIATALANYVSSMLGSPFNNKWIINDDDDEPIVCHDILVFLQNVDIELHSSPDIRISSNLPNASIAFITIYSNASRKLQLSLNNNHPISQLIRTCCEEYHGNFGCGTKTLLYLIGQWTNVCCSLKSQGIPISKILPILKESVRDCITFLDHLAISTDDFLDCSKVPQVGNDEKSDSGYLPFVSEDSVDNDVLPNLRNENSDLEDEDNVSWFLSETEMDPEPLPVSTLGHKGTADAVDDGKICFHENSEDFKDNSVLNTTTHCDTSSSSLLADDEFDECFEYLDINDGSRSAEISKTSSTETNPEIRASNSSPSFLSTNPTGKILKDNFFEYLNSKCQQFQNQALSNTVWSSRHLGSLSSENRSSDLRDDENGNISERCVISISGMETQRNDIQIVQCETSKNCCQTTDFSTEHQKRLYFQCNLKSSCKDLSDLKPENGCGIPPTNERIIDIDHLSVPKTNTKKSCNVESPDRRMRPEDFQTKEFGCYSQDVSKEMPLQCLESLVRGLCHGSNEYVEKFLVKAIQYQNRSKPLQNNYLRLNINMLHLCSIQGPSIERSRFTPGVVLSVKEEKVNFWDFTKLQNIPHNVLLVKASVCQDTHHVGYQKLAKVEKTCTKEEYLISGKMSARHKWITQVQWILKRLKVTLLVASGKVDKDLQEVLGCDGILVFENTEQSAIEALATWNEDIRTEPVVYITDATQKNILTGLFVEHLNGDGVLPADHHLRKLYVVLSAPQCQVQTLVLHHPTQTGLDLFAQEFWLSSHRVSSALRYRKVLSGRGTTEERCADYLINKADLLRKQSNSEELQELYTTEILLKLAESFQSFSKCVSLNSGGTKDLNMIHHLILDDHFTKVQAWKTALQLVSVITRIDAQVVLGRPL